MAVTKKSAIGKNTSKKPAKKSSPKATAPTASKLRTAFVGGGRAGGIS